MVNEVESILNEIRERVRNDHEQVNAPLTLDRSEELVQGSLVHPNAENGSGKSESLNRLSAHLTTTARAWDRLPPLYSNRKGSGARLELWIKARLKSMTRWFTWEQVNFNSAVHHALSETLHALSETLHALSAYRQELAATRAELRKEAEASRQRFERSDQAITAARAGIEALTAEVRRGNAKLEAAIEARVTEMAAAMTQKIDEARADVTPRLAALAGEFRESDQQLREEQRVCFKQLSLEASEAAVSEDRGRRLIESRLAELEKALSKGE